MTCIYSTELTEKPCKKHGKAGMSHKSFATYGAWPLKLSRSTTHGESTVPTRSPWLQLKRGFPLPAGRTPAVPASLVELHHAAHFECGCGRRPMRSRRARREGIQGGRLVLLYLGQVQLSLAWCHQRWAGGQAKLPAVDWVGGSDSMAHTPLSQQVASRESACFASLSFEQEGKIVTQELALDIFCSKCHATA